MTGELGSWDLCSANLAIARVRVKRQLDPPSGAGDACYLPDVLGSILYSGFHWISTRNGESRARDMKWAKNVIAGGHPYW